MAYDKFIIKNGAVIESILTGSTVLDIQGKNGQLCSITDNLVGDVFAVSDITGIPILKVNSSGKVTIDGSTDISESVTIGSNLNISGALYVGGNRTSGTNTGDQDLSNLSTYTYVNNTFLPMAGGQMTGPLVLSPGVSGGLKFPDNSFGGGGDTATMTLVNPGGSEATEMTFTMTNDVNDIVNFSVPSVDGVKVNRNTVWNAGNAGTGSYDWNAKNLYLNGSLNGATEGYFSGAVSVVGTLSIGDNNTGNLMFNRPNANYIWAYNTGGYLVFGTNGASTGVAGASFYINPDKSSVFTSTLSVASTIASTTAIFSNLTANYVPKHTTGGLVNSLTYDNGSNVLIGTTSDSSSGKLQVIGDVNASGKINFGSTAIKCQMIYNSTENSIDFIIN